MKTLLVLRHAKSDWSDPVQEDRDRPLNKRGKRDAPRMGQLLQDEDLLPDLILTSPATRACQTAEAVARSSSYGGKIQVEHALYPGRPESYLEVLQGAPDKHSRVMVVGHNPGLEDLVERLTGHPVVLPTAALARIELPMRQWRDLALEMEGRIVEVWVPRELTARSSEPTRGTKQRE